MSTVKTKRLGTCFKHVCTQRLKVSDNIDIKPTRRHTTTFLSCKEDVCFSIMDAVRTKNLPDGNMAKAWKGLLAKYEPSTAAEKVR